VFFKIPEKELSNIVKYIRKKISVFDVTIEAAEEMIGIMQERRTALISAAVTGKIDVRDWQVAA
jgi:type I restriction enzyme, S subunit